MHEPEFSTATPLVALTPRVSLREVVSLNLFVLYEVFLKLRKCSQPYDKYGEKKRLVCMADPIIIRREADNPVGQ